MNLGKIGRIVSSLGEACDSAVGVQVASTIVEGLKQDRAAAQAKLEKLEANPGVADVLQKLSRL